MYSDLSSITSNDTNINAIQNSINNILLTRRGSVPGIPRFGSDLHTLVFSQLDTLTESVAKSMILSALNEFEDRINVKGVELKQIPEYNRLLITVTYVYKDNFNKSQVEKTSISLNQM